MDFGVKFRPCNPTILEMCSYVVLDEGVSVTNIEALAVVAKGNFFILCY